MRAVVKKYFVDSEFVKESVVKYLISVAALIGALSLPTSVLCSNDEKHEALPGVEFTVPHTSKSSSGNIKLIWELDGKQDVWEKTEFELQKSRDEEFTEAKTAYTGPDRATFISGLADGMYYYRIRVIKGDEVGVWSDTVKFEVKHHSLKLALVLFFIGAIVFSATVWIVLKGASKEETV